MAIFVIAVIKERGKDIGYRVLEDTSGDMKEVSAANMYALLERGQVKLANVGLIDGKLTGTNGSLSRYPVINRNGKLMGTASPLIVLNAIGDKGFRVCDYKGSIAKYVTANVVEYSKRKTGGIANGKVVSKNGVEFISSIEGSYRVEPLAGTPEKQEAKQPEQKPAEVKQPETTRQEVKQPEPQKQAPSEVVDTVPVEVKEKIEKMKQHPEYYRSFAKDVVNTIEKYKKCSDKQREVIDRQYDKWFGSGAGAAVNVVPKGQESETDKIIEEAKKKKPYKLPDAPVTTDGYKLLYKILKDGAYITGIDNSKYIGEIVIPPSIDGHMISGIAPGAFMKSTITGVRSLAKLSNIGESAFADCMQLKYLDLRNSTAGFVPRKMCYGDARLEYVALWPGVTKIHEMAFAKCGELSELDFSIPANLSEISAKAFNYCFALEKVNNRPTIVRLGQGAFEGCIGLRQYNFEGLQSIGARAFRWTGFEQVTIPGSVRDIGNSAFMNCYKLERADIEEGVVSCGETCFYKLTSSRYMNNLEYELVKKMLDGHTVNEQEFWSQVKVVSTPKSLLNMANHAFEGVEAVEVWTGSNAESYCKAFNNKIIYKDAVNYENSTATRVASGLIDVDIIAVLDQRIHAGEAGGTKKDIEIPVNLPCNIEMTESLCSKFNIPYTAPTGSRPGTKFLGALKYLMRVSELYAVPMQGATYRLAPTLDIECEEIYKKDSNCIYKITFRTKDLYDSGSFIVVIKDGYLVYITDCNIYTDIKMSSYEFDDDYLPIEHLHSGDTIGRVFCIAGRTTYNDGTKPQEFGLDLLNKFEAHSIRITESIQNKIRYIPALGKALYLIDDRKYDSKGEIDKNTPDCLKVKKIMDEEEFFESLGKSKNGLKSDKDYFEDLKNASPSYVRQRLATIGVVAEERISHMYTAANKVREITRQLGRYPKANELDLGTLESIMKSYLAVEQKPEWFNSVNKKTLNKLNEYSVGGLEITEFRSNQVVKFMNPYMSGKKGAYVFSIRKNRSMQMKVYASVHTLDDIIKMFADMGMTDDERDFQQNGFPELIRDASTFEAVPLKLFYDFYDLLYSKNGWSVSEYSKYGYSVADGFFFKLSMYRPTGVFYIVAKTYANEKRRTPDGMVTQHVEQKVIPLFKVGDMDRALLVAATTNSKASKSQLLELMLHSANAISNLVGGGRTSRASGIGSSPKKSLEAFNNIIKARELAIAGESNVDAYVPFIGNRLVYMIGTTAKGAVLTEEEISKAQLNYDILEEIDNIEVPEEVVEESEEVIDELLGDDEDEEYDFEYEGAGEEEEAGPEEQEADEEQDEGGDEFEDWDADIEFDDSAFIMD